MSFPRISPALAAVYAPLPSSFLYHLCDLDRQNLFEQKTRERFLEVRGHVFFYMEPFVLAELLSLRSVHERRISTTWLQKAIPIFDPGKSRGEKSTPIPPQTLNNWSRSRLLRFQRWGVPEPSSVASLLVMRALTDVRRGWLPSSIIEGEPWFRVWRVDPESPHVLVPCPVPLPDHLPSSTILWSDWAGAGWLPGWISVSNLFAVRWANGKSIQRQYYWDASLDDLEKWRPGVRFPTFPQQSVSPRDRMLVASQMLHPYHISLLYEEGWRIWQEYQEATFSLSSLLRNVEDSFMLSLE